MRINKTTDNNNTCCKCTKPATYSVIHNDKTFYVCDTHRPTTTDILRANGHIQNLKGKEYVLFAGLLDLAHRNGLDTMTCRIIEYNMTDNYCIIEATVKGTRGTFVGHGDSTPDNTGKMVQSAFIRMAETRAYARALRLYTGIGMTAKEELPPQ